MYKYVQQEEMELTSLSRLVRGRGWLLMVSLRLELLVACLSHTLWKALRAAADMCHGYRTIGSLTAILCPNYNNTHTLLL